MEPCMQRGVDCLTEGCPGNISYAALQQGARTQPEDVQVLVHPEENKTVEPQAKHRHEKPKKKAQHKGKDKVYHKGALPDMTPHI